MRAADTLRVIPIFVVALPGCAVSVRAGPQTKVLSGDLTAEGQATVAVGATAGGAGSATFAPVLTLGGGVIPRTSRGTGAFEGGGDYQGAVSDGVSLRLGPRLGATWGEYGGAFLGVRGGIVVALSKSTLGDSYPVVSLEALAGPGLSGDLNSTFVGGLGLSFGYEKYGTFRIPSGRPILRDGEPVVAPLVEGRCWREATRPARATLPASLRQTVGRAWLADARLEHASIASFAKLSLDLLACGAPPELVAGAHRAALDEVRHAKLCFALASDYLEEEIDPGAMPPIAAGRASLEELAVEALVEGVVGEGFAARLASARMSAAKDETVRRVLRVIAREEKRHAELGWHVIAWACSLGGEPVVAAVRAAWERERHKPPPNAEDDARREELSAYGIPAARDVEQTLRRTRRAVAGRMSALAPDRAT